MHRDTMLGAENDELKSARGKRKAREGRRRAPVCAGAVATGRLRLNLEVFVCSPCLALAPGFSTLVVTPAEQLSEYSRRSWISYRLQVCDRRRGRDRGIPEHRRWGQLWGVRRPRQATERRLRTPSGPRDQHPNTSRISALNYRRASLQDVLDDHSLRQVVLRTRAPLLGVER